MHRRLALAIAFSLFVLTGPVASQAQRDAAVEVHYTKDRLTQEHMEELVASAMALVRGKDLAGARREFDRLMASAVGRYGGRSIEVADLLTAFGVLVYEDGRISENDETKRASIPYLRRAVDAYRFAFGSQHPEVAVALHSLADVEIELDPENPPAAAEAALEEAYAIRLRALGPTNAETLDVLLRLANIRSVPNRTQGDPARIGAAEAAFREGLSIARSSSRAAVEQDPVSWLFGIARLYARHHQMAPALAAVAEALREPNGEDQCYNFSYALGRLGAWLIEHGLGPEADALEQSYPYDSYQECPDPGEVDPPDIA
jgi:hypothetical protein